MLDKSNKAPINGRYYKMNKCGTATSIIQKSEACFFFHPAVYGVV